MHLRNTPFIYQKNTHKTLLFVMLRLKRNFFYALKFVASFEVKNFK